MLRAILNKSWRQHLTKHLYGHLPPITKIIQVIRTRHAGHCRRSRDELISDILHGRAKAGRPARTYIRQLCTDTGCSPEDLPEAMDDREGLWERVRDICADGATWWWWSWPTVVESDQRAPFSIATTPKCRGGRSSISRIKYHLLSLWYDSTWDWTQNLSNQLRAL